MLSVSTNHRVAVSMMLTLHWVIKLALPMVILKEMTGRLPTNEKEKTRPKESSMHFYN